MFHRIFKRREIFSIGKDGFGSKSDYFYIGDTSRGVEIGSETDSTAGHVIHDIKYTLTKAQQHYSRSKEHVGALRRFVALLDADCSDDNQDKLKQFKENLEYLEKSIDNRIASSISLEHAVEDDNLIRDYSDICMTTIDYYLEDSFKIRKKGTSKEKSKHFDAMFLAISKPLVKIPNGNISVKHNPGNSTIFDESLSHIRENLLLPGKKKTHGLTLIKKWYRNSRRSTAQLGAAFHTTIGRFSTVEFSNSSVKKDSADTQDFMYCKSTPANNLTDNLVKNYMNLYIEEYTELNKQQMWFEKSLPKSLRLLILDEIKKAIVASDPTLLKMGASHDILIEQAKKILNAKMDDSVFVQAKGALSNSLSNPVTNLRLLGAANAHERRTHTIYKDSGGEERQLWLSNVTNGIISSEREQGNVSEKERVAMAKESLLHLIEMSVRSHGGIESFSRKDSGQKVYVIDINFYSLIQASGREGKERFYKKKAVQELCGIRDDARTSDFEGHINLFGKPVCLKIKNTDRSINIFRDKSENLDDKKHFSTHVSEDFYPRSIQSGLSAQAYRPDTEKILLDDKSVLEKVVNLDDNEVARAVIRKHIPDIDLYEFLEKPHVFNSKESVDFLSYLMTRISEYPAGSIGVKELKAVVAGAASTAEAFSECNKSVYEFLKTRALVIIKTKRDACNQVKILYEEKKVKFGHSLAFSNLKTLNSYFNANKNNRIYDAALQNFYYDISGGCTIGGCHSGKDRTSAVLLYKDAIQNIFSRTGIVPNIRHAEQKKELEEEIAFLVATGHYTRIAEMNCRGCMGMKSLLTYLPSPVQALLKNPNEKLRVRVKVAFQNEEVSGLSGVSLEEKTNNFCKNIYKSILDQDYASRLNAVYNSEKSESIVDEVVGPIMRAAAVRDSRVLAAVGIGAVVTSPISVPALVAEPFFMRPAKVAFSYMEKMANNALSKIKILQKNKQKESGKSFEFIQFFGKNKILAQLLVESFSNGALYVNAGITNEIKNCYKDMAIKYTLDREYKQALKAFEKTFCSIIRTLIGKKAKKDFQLYLMGIEFQQKNQSLSDGLKTVVFSEKLNTFKDSIKKSYLDYTGNIQDSKRFIKVVANLVSRSMKKETKAYLNELERELKLKNFEKTRAKSNDMPAALLADSIGRPLITHISTVDLSTYPAVEDARFSVFERTDVSVVDTLKLPVKPLIQSGKIFTKANIPTVPPVTHALLPSLPVLPESAPQITPTVISDSVETSLLQMIKDEFIQDNTSETGCNIEYKRVGNQNTEILSYSLPDQNTFHSYDFHVSSKNKLANQLSYRSKESYDIQFAISISINASSDADILKQCRQNIRMDLPVTIDKKQKEIDVYAECIISAAKAHRAKSKSSLLVLKLKNPCLIQAVEMLNNKLENKFDIRNESLQKKLRTKKQ